MEQEFGGPVEYVHTLGPGISYLVNEHTGKIDFGDGVPGDATHQMLLGEDSPQVATKRHHVHERLPGPEPDPRVAPGPGRPCSHRELTFRPDGGRRTPGRPRRTSGGSGPGRSATTFGP